MNGNPPLFLTRNPFLVTPGSNFECFSEFYLFLHAYGTQIDLGWPPMEREWKITYVRYLGYVLNIVLHFAKLASKLIKKKLWVLKKWVFFVAREYGSAKNTRVFGCLLQLHRVADVIYRFDFRKLEGKHFKWFK